MRSPAMPALCQEQDIVPIVEPEVLMDGPAAGHDIERCYEVSALVLRTVFNELYDARVELESMVLKPSMVVAGKSATAGYARGSGRENRRVA